MIRLAIAGRLARHSRLRGATSPPIPMVPPRIWLAGGYDSTIAPLNSMEIFCNAGGELHTNTDSVGNCDSNGDSNSNGDRDRHSYSNSNA